MEIEGLVTNVTAFGAFVDVGVHQDGLVPLSQLADRFVGEASEVVRLRDRLKVRVLEVDLVRRRISLSAKSGAPRSGPKPAASSTAGWSASVSHRHSCRGAAPLRRDRRSSASHLAP
jgi:uncharacterized protein